MFESRDQDIRRDCKPKLSPDGAAPSKPTTAKIIPFPGVTLPRIPDEPYGGYQQSQLQPINRPPEQAEKSIFDGMRLPTIDQDQINPPLSRIEKLVLGMQKRDYLTGLGLGVVGQIPVIALAARSVFSLQMIPSSSWVKCTAFILSPLLGYAGVQMCRSAI